MQDRLRSYEERIHELENDLAERNEENRELLKLKIEMTRRQLEAERARSRVDFN
jgi:cytochrome c-type biogenesis protein CcmH/NrfG